MPRQARKKSESGIYHVMLRGINQQQIFEDDKDYEKFLGILKECKEICGFKLFAYCLMGNHIHLLIKEGAESLEQIFKRICGRFVYWYNIKYQRVGHLFQDRFKSEPVDSERYLFTVLRYIHQNPTKAGLCKQVENYAYSSYREYIKVGELVDTAYILEYITLEEFINLNHEEVDAAGRQGSVPCLEKIILGQLGFLPGTHGDGSLVLTKKPCGRDVLDPVNN